MMDEHKILLLRFCYWLGAVLDALFAIDMTIIALFDSASVLSIFFTSSSAINTGGLEYNYAMSISAVLMWGWTFLLLWADRKPVDRKDILPLTAFPVIPGLMISNLIAGSVNLILFEEMILRIAVQSGLLLLFLFSYLNARNVQ